MRLIITKRALPTWWMKSQVANFIFFISTLAQYILGTNLNSKKYIFWKIFISCRWSHAFLKFFSNDDSSRWTSTRSYQKKLECYSLRCRLAFPLFIVIYFALILTVGVSLSLRQAVQIFVLVNKLHKIHIYCIFSRHEMTISHERRRFCLIELTVRV